MEGGKEEGGVYKWNFEEYRSSQMFQVLLIDGLATCHIY